jgi:tRNA pseudouridine(55) synthase
VTVAHAASELDRKPRSVAIGTFDGVHLGHRRVVEAAVAAGQTPTVVTFDPHPRTVLGNQVELPIPAASAVKIGGERAYKLARRGIAVEMPMRRSRVDVLDVIAYTGDTVRLDLRVSSGTYVRSIAAALGGHCRTLRRLEIGPFDVTDADPDRFIAPEDALAALEMA